MRALSVIRYADDFVIIHEDLETLNKLEKVTTEWLKDIGLELNQKKTQKIHILEEFEGKQPGFDFLGFNIRQYKVGKYNSAKNTNGAILHFKTLIKPSKKAIKKHINQIFDIIDQYKGLKQDVLISRLNPIIRGWTNYYKAVASKTTFSRIAHLIFWKLMRWAKGRHHNKGRKWRKNKYFLTIGNRQWVFGTKIKGNPHTLINHADTKIERHIKIKEDASPYDGNLKYWSTRKGESHTLPTKVAKLLKSQKGKCKYCGMFFKEEDEVEIDHIIPRAKGGKDTYQNLQLLHIHCHEEKTRKNHEYRKP